MAHALKHQMTFQLIILGIAWICSGHVQSAEPLTPAEWSQRFQCRPKPGHLDGACPSRFGAGRSCNISRRLEPADVCRHDPGNWMWKYVDEMEPEHQVLVREASLDERLANMAYALVTTRALDNELAKVDAADERLAADVRRRLIGRQVNETRCGQQLAGMVDLMARFQATLEQRRSNLRGGLEAHLHSQYEDEPLGEQFIRLARVLDSYGRYVSGMMSGKHLLFGSYDQCINSQLLLDGEPDRQPQQLVQMRYCWAQVTLESSVSPELAQRKRFPFEVGQTGLQVAVCLPDSCHSHSFPHYREHIQHLLGSQFHFPSSIYLQRSPNISHISCVADGQSPMLLEWPTSGRILVALAGLWLLLIALATYYCTTTKPSACHDWMRCISFVDNWNDFLEIDRKARMAKLEPETTDLDVLNPIKCVSCLWVTLVHALLTIHIASNEVLRDHKLMDTYRSMTVVISSPLVLETYFVLSGILTTYLALKQMDKRRQTASVQASKDINNNNNNNSHVVPTHENANSKQRDLNQEGWLLVQLARDCLAIMGSRFLRLVPMYYLMFWFKKSLMVFMGSGPLWNHGLNRHSGGQCQHESWWSPLRPSSVYDPVLAKCLPQSYTISSELIFVCIIAPLIVLIGRFPRTIVSLALLMGSASCLAGLAAYQAIDTAVIWNLADYRSFGVIHLFSAPVVSRLFTAPEHRLFSILFGVVVGWLVYRRELDRKNRMKNTTNGSCSIEQVAGDDDLRRSTRWLTLASVAFFVWILVAGAYRRELRRWLDPYHRLWYGHQLMGARFGWAASSAWLSLRLLTDWNQRPLVGWWTKSKFWKILSKLNYSILLLHLDLLMLDWQFRSNETTLTIYKLMSTFICAYAISIAIGIGVFILFENPLNRLVRRYII